MAVEYKVGDNVRILDADKIREGLKHWNTGDITELEDIWDTGQIKLKPTVLTSGNSGNFLDIDELEFIELVGSFEEFMNYLNSLEDKIESLEKRVMELEGESNENKVFTTNIYATVSDKLNSKELASKIIETFNKYNKEEVKLSNNELRKQVIEDAKSLLKANENNKQIQFINNKDKEIITCVVIDEYSGKVVTQGVAKTTVKTKEAYNEHIGKAIALCKALNINSDKYKNVPLPDKVVVGMKVRMKYSGSDRYYTQIISEINLETVKYENGGWDFVDKLKQDTTSILEDTNAQY